MIKDTTYPKVASTIACLLAGAALAVSLTHTGPRGYQGAPGVRGSQGPAGKAGVSATQDRLGICWTAPSSDALVAAGYTAVAYVFIDRAIYGDGVYTCPQGETFTSIVPGPAKP